MGRAITQAAMVRARQGDPLQDKAIHHSDAGSQYTPGTVHDERMIDVPTSFRTNCERLWVSDYPVGVQNGFRFASTGCISAHCSAMPLRELC